MSAGREVEAYCTKCKMDLDHRIVAMSGDRIARVECLTCRGQHNYRRPRSAEPAPTVRRRGGQTPPSSGVGKKRVSTADQLKQRWEQAIMGKSPADFTPYTIAAVLAEGQLVRHKKFGEGVVAELIEGGKAEVLFEDGTKTLVYGR